MTILQALIAARAKIDAPEKWTKGAMARDKNGNSVEHDASDAVSWSVAGAMETGPWFNHAFNLLEEFLPEPLRFLDGYEDDPATTHADIMALFDRAIAAERERL
jgi:hypothetical protein